MAKNDNGVKIIDLGSLEIGTTVVSFTNFVETWDYFATACLQSCHTCTPDFTKFSLCVYRDVGANRHRPFVNEAVTGIQSGKFNHF